MANEVDTVKKIYTALNRNELSTYLSFFDERIERFESFGGRFQGLAELETNFTQGRETWAEGSCDPEKFTVVGNKVVVFVHVNVRQKNQDKWIHGHVTDVFTFEGPKVIQFYSFDKRDEALKWADVN